MMKRLHHMLLLLALILTACGTGSDRVVPTPLPTAVPPEHEPGTWAIGFSHEFPAEFWSEGRHRYGFHLDCPVAGQENFGSEWQEFEVSSQVVGQPFPVYLRITGVSSAPFGGPLPNSVIHPLQPTIANLLLLGLSRQSAERAVSECEAVVAWDNNRVQVLSVGEPFQP